MEKLIKKEIELRDKQANLGYLIVVFTFFITVIILILPLGSILIDSNIKFLDVILSEGYLKLLTCISIPLIVGLAAGIILVKSNVQKIAESAAKCFPGTQATTSEKEIEIIEMSSENE